MGLRIHTTELKNVNVFVADTETLVGLYGLDWKDIKTALVIEDAGNMEVWVIDVDGVGGLRSVLAMVDQAVRRH